MSTPINVLIVEDSIADAKLILNELRSGGFEPMYDRVETEQEMQSALASRSWDIVLSDYRMPGFSGPDALALLRSSGRDIPFIIVSGTIGEMHAVEAMRTGANDYVMKDNLMRLSPAISRELLEAQERRKGREADAARRESEEWFRMMADCSAALIWLAGPDNHLSYVNKSMLEFFNQALEEIIGHDWLDYVHPDDADQVRTEYRASGIAGVIYQSEFRMRRHDGQWRLIAASAARRLHADGSYAGRVGVCIDLTELKGAEIERERMREENEQLLRERVASAAQQRAFLRDVMSSVTEGKLRLCDSATDLPPKRGNPRMSFSINAESLTTLRSAVQELADEVEMQAERVYDLVTSVNEAGMNAVVHAGGGRARMFADANCVQVWIEDSGLGIDISELPRATLERGYTTANTFGHGFFMILNCIDRMYLLTGSDGTTVVLEQQRIPPELPWFADSIASDETAKHDTVSV